MHGPVTLVEDVAGTATASAKSSTVLETILLQDAHAKRKDQRNMRDVAIHINHIYNHTRSIPYAAAESSLDVFFVSSNAWGASSALLLRLPQAISFPSCDVEPLTPWLQPQEVQCNFVAGSMVCSLRSPA
eukprot:symbB.v1.2.022385.t1/scaffold1983.1/size166549/1